MRQVVLDTETTGLEVHLDHRIIEIGCVELVNRRLTGRHFHRYVNPERDIDVGAQQIHGISREELVDKPVFAQIAGEFLDFVAGAELVIHNAAFDVGFINHELGKLQSSASAIERHCGIVDTLLLARQLFPGQKNSLDALCRRYGVDNSHRRLHGALLDAEILADVYLMMTGGQVDLTLGNASSGRAQTPEHFHIRRLDPKRAPLRVIRANNEEQIAHQEKLENIRKAAGGKCLWNNL